MHTYILTINYYECVVVSRNSNTFDHATAAMVVANSLVLDNDHAAFHNDPPARLYCVCARACVCNIYFPAKAFSPWATIHSGVTDLGLSRGRPSARSQNN